MSQRNRILCAVGIVHHSAMSFAWNWVTLLAVAKAWAGFVDVLEKIHSGRVPSPTSVASLQLAKGECEAIQVYVQPGTKAVRADILGPAFLKPQVYREAFVTISTPSNNEGKKGLWADKLIPERDFYTSQLHPLEPADSTKHHPLVLFLEWCTHRHHQAGKFPLTLRLSAANQAPLELPITLEVLAFSLPETSSLLNTFGISRRSIAHGHGLDPESPEARQLLFYYGQALLRHRLSAYGMGMDPPEVSVKEGKVHVDFSSYDLEMRPFLEGHALPNGAQFTTTDVRMSPRLKTVAEKIQYLQAFERHFRTEGWTALLFYYAPDEPKPRDFGRVHAVAQLAHRSGNIPVLVTSAFHPALTSAVDIWAPNLNCFFPRPGLSTCQPSLSVRELRKRVGKRRVFWYQSCMAHGCDLGPVDDESLAHAYSGWASYMVDIPATRNRAMGPLAFLEGIDGELYFDTVYAYNQEDPWNNIWAFGGNGDGTLFYPGTPDTVGGTVHFPIESIRLKHIRDGLEDYEWLTLAEKLGAKSAAQTAVKAWVETGYSTTQDPSAWQKARKQLGQHIQAKYLLRE